MAFDEDYLSAIEPVGHAYREPIEAHLQQLALILAERGWATDGPIDISADNYEYTLMVWVTGAVGKSTDAVAVNVSIEEERDHDGGEGFGMNFCLQVFAPDGRVLGELQPHNYSDQVWVDARDEEAVKARWEEFIGADASQLPDLICKGAQS